MLKQVIDLPGDELVNQPPQPVSMDSLTSLVAPPGGVVIGAVEFRAGKVQTSLPVMAQEAVEPMRTRQVERAPKIK